MKKKIAVLVLLVFLLGFETGNSPQGIFIRLNQVGFLQGDLKSAVVLSKQKLDKRKFSLIDVSSNKSVYSGQLGNSIKENGSFNYSYSLSFSPLNKSGTYQIEIEASKSNSFRIGTDIYNNVVDSLMLFFRVQSCGYTNPIEHAVCHPDDASKVIVSGATALGKVDVTGGWHDAGDYVKFLNTAAFTTYTLLFAYDFDPVKFGFDNNKNGVPDILEEAKVGLDWLLRLNYAKSKLITQVQDMRDHDQGWRMPENDGLANDRPAFTGIGKNLIGIYAATLSLASRIWRNKLQYYDFADKCLAVAKDFYAIRNNVPDLDKVQSGMYQDSRYFGKLALGAIELYITTKDNNYLTDAVSLADKASSDYWWSWGDINAYAHYRIASYDQHVKEYLLGNLNYFNNNKNKNLFGEAAIDSWGSNNAVLGAALQSIIWKKLTGDSSYDSLAIAQRDFILGKNQWGTTFIHNIGTVFPQNLHSPITYYHHGYLPGAVAAGPVSKKKLNDFKLNFEKKDRFRQFQTEEAVYQDIIDDFITNEPTIVTNATAIFVMGYYSDRK